MHQKWASGGGIHFDYSGSSVEKNTPNRAYIHTVRTVNDVLEDRCPFFSKYVGILLSKNISIWPQGYLSPKKDIYLPKTSLTVRTVHAYIQHTKYLKYIKSVSGKEHDV